MNHKIENKINDSVDNIRDKNSKRSVHSLLSILSDLFNSFLESATFLDQLGLAVTILLNNKEEQNDVMNYRCVNLLTGFPKLFEISLSLRIINFSRNTA